MTKKTLQERIETTPSDIDKLFAENKLSKKELFTQSELLRKEIYRLKKTQRIGELAFRYLQAEGIEYKIGVSLITGELIEN